MERFLTRRVVGAVSFPTVDPKLHEANTHRTLSLNDVGFTYKLEAAATDGTLAVLEITIPPRTLVKPTPALQGGRVLTHPLGKRRRPYR